MSAARAAAEQAASAAEQVISDFLGSGDWQVRYKSDDTPVTEVDVATEHAIRQVLVQAFPQASFFGEETGKSAAADAVVNNTSGVNAVSELRWLVDPIDGTKSFIRAMPFYSTQIALEHNGQFCLGVSNAPAYGERLVAVAGQGVWLNAAPVQCSKVTSIDEAFMSTGNVTSLASDASQWQCFAQVVKRARRVRGYGDFCHYHQWCCGQTDLVIESDVNILDIAALSVGVHAAGGLMTDMAGQPVVESTSSVLAACTTELHAQALALLGSGVSGTH